MPFRKYSTPAILTILIALCAIGRAEIEVPLVAKMHHAAAMGNVAEFQKYLDQGLSIYEADMLNNSAAYYAAQAGRWNIVELLFSRGYDPLLLRKGHPQTMRTYQRGLEILPWASKYGRLDWVEKLISKGVDLDAKKASDREVDDPLCMALLYHRDDVVEFLLKNKCPLNWTIAMDQEGPDAKYSTMGVLHLAVRNKNLKLIGQLIESGIDVNKANGMGISPLMLAVDYNWLEGVEFLLGAGADTDAKDISKKDALAYAEPHPEIHDVLLRKKLGITKNQNVLPQDQLMLAINAANLPDIAKLLESPELANAVDQNGVPALVHASRLGKIEPVQLLLKAKAKPNKCSPDGDSALYQAVANQHPAVASLLLKAGADPNLYASSGRPTLQRSIELRDFATAELLLEKGANPDTFTEGRGWGGPPVSLAAQAGNLKLVALLVAKGANIQAKDSDGVGALNYACSPKGEAAIIEFLVNLGLDINAPSPVGDTPLAMAVAYSKPNVVRKMLALGAKPVALDRALNELSKRDEQKEILAVLQAADPEAVGDSAFWTQNPTRKEIINFINSGGDPNYAGDKSPLWNALYTGDFELAEILLDHNADPNLSGHVHQAPLWALISGADHGKMEDAVRVTKKMLRLGANPNGNPKKESRSIFGVSPPLRSAVQSGRGELVELLLQAGADPAPGLETLEKDCAALDPTVQARLRNLLEKQWPKPVTL